MSKTQLKSLSKDNSYTSTVINKENNVSMKEIEKIIHTDEGMKDENSFSEINSEKESMQMKSAEAKRKRSAASQSPLSPNKTQSANKRRQSITA